MQTRCDYTPARVDPGVDSAVSVMRLKGREATLGGHYDWANICLYVQIWPHKSLYINDGWKVHCLYLAKTRFVCT